MITKQKICPHGFFFEHNCPTCSLLLPLRSEVAALKAENERLVEERDELQKCLGTPEEIERELAEECRLLDMASEAEGIVADLAKWSKLSDGHPNTADEINNMFERIVGRACAHVAAKAEKAQKASNR